MKRLKEFEKFFETDFRETKNQYTNSVRKAKKIADIFRILSICFCILFSSIIVCLSIFNAKNIVIYCIIGVVIFSILLGFSYYDFFIKEEIKEKFISEDKEKIISGILEKDYEYIPKGRVTTQIVKESKLFKDFDEMSGEDLVNLNVIQNEYSAQIQFSEIVLKNIERENGEVVEKPIFSGTFGKIIFSKSLGVDIKINLNSDEEMEKYITESELFNNNFELQVKNKKSGNKYFGAGVMLALLNLSLLTKSKLQVRIVGENLYFATNKPLFEFDLEKCVEFENVKKIYTEIDSVVNIAKESIKRCLCREG